MDFSILLIILACYLWGAVPTSYLAARYLKGIDIRRYGSGNAGATNVMVHVGKRTGLIVGVFDCLAKGTLPVLVVGLLDMGLAAQAAAGLSAIAGHCWSPYIRFTGGRGVATAIGVAVGFGILYEITIVIFALFIGRVLLKETGFWTFASLLALPVLTLIFNRPIEAAYMTVVMAALLLTKRLTANWEPPIKGRPIAQVFICRLLWDRDVPRKEEWTKRHPISEISETEPTLQR